jgi:DNA helicase-2/ATP-dependent DNA helicase PcrA
MLIIVRFNSLSRNIEAALQIAGIPNRVLKGKRFFERAEVGRYALLVDHMAESCLDIQVKDLLAYLQIVDNGSYLPAFMRTINTPPRQLGEKVSSRPSHCLAWTHHPRSLSRK